MNPLEEGLTPPNIVAPEAGTPVPFQLSTLRGRAIILYFYPKADTPSCTNEALDFTGLAAAFAQAGAEVVGVSPDSCQRLVRFRDKHDLKIRLVEDRDAAIARAYGLWVEKTLYGRTFIGVERATVLIDKGGKIARVWRKVRVKGHAEEVLAALRAL